MPSRCFMAPLLLNGQVEKQDTSGNECERKCESETVDHVIVVSTCLFLRATLKAGLILILARTGLKKLKQLQTGCYGFVDPRTPVQKVTERQLRSL